MPIAFRRSIRQLISIVAGGAAAYGTYVWTKESRIFEGVLQASETWGPPLAAVAAFFVVYYLVSIFISGKAAR